MTTVADYVAAGRCVECGQLPSNKRSDPTCASCGQTIPVWTPGAQVDAAHRWTRDHNGAPPTAHDWDHAGYGHPANTTPWAVFGNWTNFMLACGYTPRPATWGISIERWDRDRIAAAMLDWLLSRGSWPRFIDWLDPDRGECFPHANTVLHHFPKWTDAKKYAGWVAEARCARCNCLHRERTAGCRACTDRHRARRLRGLPYETLGVEPAPPRVACGGCGTDLNNLTVGCRQCRERQRGRERRRLARAA